MTNENVDPAERLAMFRYCVISEAISPRLSPAERGRVVRELAWATPVAVASQEVPQADVHGARWR